MRINVKTLNRRYSKGGISKMMIVNVILAVLIVSAISILLINDENNRVATAPNSPANVTKTSPSASPDLVNSQSEIDALKKQLSLETAKLGTLREDKKRIDEIREASEANSL